jgi:hypothetical protein
MLSQTYRSIIALIVRNLLFKEFPGLKKKEHHNKVMIMSADIARAIHARMYGTNVDGLESPIWRKEDGKIDASELLKDEKLNEKNSVDKLFVSNG